MADEEVEPRVVEAVEPRVVEAVGSAVGNGALGGGKNPALKQALEAADVAAVNSIIAEGIQLDNTEAILERKRQYRDEVRRLFGQSPELPAEPVNET